jgi:hypothetical protein
LLLLLLLLNASIPVSKELLHGKGPRVGWLKEHGLVKKGVVFLRIKEFSLHYLTLWNG